MIECRWVTSWISRLQARRIFVSAQASGQPPGPFLPHLSRRAGSHQRLTRREASERTDLNAKMTKEEQRQFPENHPVKKLFRTLTDRALIQSDLPDGDLLRYLTDLLVEFMCVENLYRIKDERGRRIEYLIDMLQEAEKVPRSIKKDYYRQIGDYSLFVLGMFPESLCHGKKCIPASYYADTGRRSYGVLSRLDWNNESHVVFRKLEEKFERCVLCLNWVSAYTRDPFYLYMFQQFGIT